MAFKLNQNADINGTSSRGTIPDITAEMMQQVFGDPVWGEGYGLGLGSKEWYFVSDDGQVVRAYDMGSRRYPGLSVGARSDTIVEPFVAWLRSEVQQWRSNNSSLAQHSIHDNKWGVYHSARLDNNPSPVRHSNTNCLLVRVAGVTFDNRQEIVAQLHPMEAVRLRRDLLNPYDRHAVRIENLAGNQIGFVPREQSPQISALLDSIGGMVIGWVHELTGGVSDYPNRGVIIGLEVPYKPSDHYDYEEDDTGSSDYDDSSYDPDLFPESNMPDD